MNEISNYEIQNYISVVKTVLDGVLPEDLKEQLANADSLEEKAIIIINYTKDSIDSHFESIEKTINYQRLSEIKAEIRTAKSLYYEALDNPEIQKQKLESAHDKLLSSCNQLFTESQRIYQELDNTKFKKRNYKKIDDYINRFTEICEMMQWTLELEFSVNQIRKKNISRSFYQVYDDFLAFIEENRIHCLILSSCGDDNAIYDKWFTMYHSFKKYLTYETHCIECEKE
ncbi:MAG: hypothetical protein MR503_07485 [Oscillospiraceae bacterium]|nr:hypothetical protein [Oscillospiraceae bacterium]